LSLATAAIADASLCGAGSMGIGIAADGDPVLTEAQVRRWFDPNITLSRPVRRGNRVNFLVDGSVTFQVMAEELRKISARPFDYQFAYLLGWWLSDNFPLVPGDAESTMYRLLRRAGFELAAQVCAMLWKQQTSTQNRDEVKRINATGMLPSGRLAGGAVL